ncbi:MAG: redox-sensing transcriptional repressor Rex [Parasporobacterium sp.]|nr:redox-sensing transcriptional repressor Rex [Parasporobacterium sp.]
MAVSKSENISKAVISRLPRYYRYLRELIERDVERISSEELSRLMGATASQIRQDLNHFGGFGQQGYGYNVKSLYNEIGKILGVEEPHKLIVVGAGNLGRALLKYQGFSAQGFNFCGIFDTDKQLVGKTINGIRIMHTDDIPAFIQKNSVDIAALALPRESAKSVSQFIYSNGVKYFWNFAHTDLELPSDAIVKNVHLLDSLLELSFTISNQSPRK